MQVAMGCGGALSQILIVGGILVGVVAVARRAHRARAEALTDLGRRLGLAFAASTGDPPAPPSLAQPGTRGTYVLSGRLDGREATVFDYTIGSGKGARTQTVVTVRAERRPLPAFLLTPESFVDKLAATMGGQDLDFEGDTEFSKAFRLRGDEAGVRKLFGPSVRARLRDLVLPERLRVEAWDDRFAIWAPGAVVKPERLQDRLRLAAEVASALGR